MKRLIRYFILVLMIGLGCWSTFRAEAANHVADYINIPPVLTVGGVDPNLLLLIDNSASMNDLAYVDDQRYCYDDNYDPGSAHVGYFEPGTWYGYNLGAEKFAANT